MSVAVSTWVNNSRFKSEGVPCLVTVPHVWSFAKLHGCFYSDLTALYVSSFIALKIKSAFFKFCLIDWTTQMMIYNIHFEAMNHFISSLCLSHEEM